MAGKAWFSPKRYGYGASLPISWQGWLVLAIFLALMIPAKTELRGLALAAAVTVLVVGLAAICFWKTEGGWKWRWGSRR